MVLDEDLVDLIVEHGDSKDGADSALEALKAWLGTQPDVEERDAGDETLIIRACDSSFTEAAEILIAHGANVNAVAHYDGCTPLQIICHTDGTDRIERIRLASLFVSSGADVNQYTDRQPEPPIIMLSRLDPNLEMLTIFLRAGASPNALTRKGVDLVSLLAEESRHFANLPYDNPDIQARISHLDACRDLVLAVREAGSWRDYCRGPHRALLRLRSLRARGRALSTPATPRHVELLLTALPDGVLWNVLTFWHAVD
mmetsp:Transcript_27177/g.81980  ORF Transcript_27177/g.81980 Transcript_27177/m.81980 type:complete len:257 (+) Transcript_27177:1489-2259(+)